MLTMSIRDARAALGKLVDRAERGETVVVTRHGKPSACLTPVPGRRRELPSLHDFRATIVRPKEGLSKTVMGVRREERG